MILIIYAHPYPQHSHANKRMLEQARTLDGVEIRSLYQLYPDFNIDVAAEQQALARARLIIWQHPMQWYSVPPFTQTLDGQSPRAWLGLRAWRHGAPG
ncbi:glutathione-regulated potassium-efflux system ancillary protein KefF [Citrobacter koseri]|nr:glutathione-regulated potassium-efflux system ancillary protein KefF [Citrobacter koseri]